MYHFKLSNSNKVYLIITIFQRISLENAYLCHMKSSLTSLLMHDHDHNLLEHYDREIENVVVLKSKFSDFLKNIIFNSNGIVSRRFFKENTLLVLCIL